MLSSEEEEQLKQACIQAKSNSYSPYSKFRVGASFLFSNGEIVKGANVENASYPAGICAERSAIAIAVNQGLLATESIKAVGVTSDTDNVVSPCGICRQTIREFASLDTPIYMWTSSGAVTVRTLEELLPLSFGPDNLA